MNGTMDIGLITLESTAQLIRWAQNRHHEGGVKGSFRKTVTRLPGRYHKPTQVNGFDRVCICMYVKLKNIFLA